MGGAHDIGGGSGLGGGALPPPPNNPMAPIFLCHITLDYS